MWLNIFNIVLHVNTRDRAMKRNKLATPMKLPVGKELHITSDFKPRLHMLSKLGRLHMLYWASKQEEPAVLTVSLRKWAGRGTDTSLRDRKTERERKTDMWGYRTIWHFPNLCLPSLCVWRAEQKVEVFGGNCLFLPHKSCVKQIVHVPVIINLKG